MACGWKLQEFHSYIRLHDLRICEDLRILFLFIPLGSYRKPETPTPEESVTARKQCELSTDVTSSCYSKPMHSVDVGQVWGTLSVGNLLLLWGTMNRRSVEAFASFHAPGLFTGTKARDRSAPVARALLFFFLTYPSRMYRMFKVLGGHLTGQRQENGSSCTFQHTTFVFQQTDVLFVLSWIPDSTVDMSHLRLT